MSMSSSFKAAKLMTVTYLGKQTRAKYVAIPLPHYIVACADSGQGKIAVNGVGWRGQLKTIRKSIWRTASMTDIPAKFQAEDLILAEANCANGAWSIHQVNPNTSDGNTHCHQNGGVRTTQGYIQGIFVVCSVR